MPMGPASSKKMPVFPKQIGLGVVKPGRLTRSTRGLQPKLDCVIARVRETETLIAYPHFNARLQDTVAAIEDQVIIVMHANNTGAQGKARRKARRIRRP